GSSCALPILREAAQRITATTAEAGRRDGAFLVGSRELEGGIYEGGWTSAPIDCSMLIGLAREKCAPARRKKCGGAVAQLRSISAAGSSRRDTRPLARE